MPPDFQVTVPVALLPPGIRLGSGKSDPLSLLKSSDIPSEPMPSGATSRRRPRLSSHP